MVEFLKKNFYLIVLAILVLFVFAKFFQLLSFNGQPAVLEKGEDFELKPGNAVTQRFAASRGNFFKMELLLRQSNVKKGNEISAELMDGSCGRVIEKGLLKQSFLSSDNLFEFRFSAVQNSSDENFCIRLTASKKTRFFTAGTAGNEFFMEGAAIDAKKSENRSLSMRPVYANDHWWQNVSELNQRISQYKPWFLKHYFLYVISFGFVFLSVFLIIILIRL